VIPFRAADSAAAQFWGCALGVVACVWPAVASAQVAPAAADRIAVGDWKLAPLLEVRVRGEYRRDLDAQHKGVLTERARLGLGVERGSIEGRVVLQDVRLWDLGLVQPAVGQPAPFASTGAYEAWGEAHTSGAHPSFVRVGRQPVTWGEGRLLGIADWSPTGRSLDAVRGRLVTSDWAFELLAAALSDVTTAAGGTSLVVPSYGELFGARVGWSFDPLLAFEAYGLARLAQQNPVVSLEDTVRGQTYTGAVRAYGTSRAWSWGIEGAYQGGHVDLLSEDRSAWAAAAHVGTTFEHAALLPTVFVAASYASGDDGNTGTYHAFDPLLPDVHKWHGAMDLFAWSNEAEASARFAIAPWTDAAAAVEYRYALLAQAAGAWRAAYLETVGVAPSNADPALGHEIDASLRWSPWVAVELLGGYSIAVLEGGAKAILVAPKVGSVPTSGTIVQPGLAHFAYVQAVLDVP
jgi:hypothetical protein